MLRLFVLAFLSVLSVDAFMAPQSAVVTRATTNAALSPVTMFSSGGKAAPKKAKKAVKKVVKKPVKKPVKKVVKKVAKKGPAKPTSGVASATQKAFSKDGWLF